MNQQPRRQFLRTSLLAGSGLAAAVWAPPASKAKETVVPLCDRFFIMSAGFFKSDLSIAQIADWLQRIGNPRFDYTIGNDEKRFKEFPESLRTMKRKGIDLITVYSTIEIDSGILPQWIKDLIGLLKGSGAILWISLTSEKYKSSDPAGDRLAIPILREAADLAKENGLRISIYPHCNFWVERIGDALRLALHVDRENLGCTFNLFHWLYVEGPKDLEKKAKLALPKLNCVTINGSLKNASELMVTDGILPLGEGDYDTEAFIRTFIRLGYTGPFGFQGYGFEGDITGKMERSLKVWKEYCQRM